MILASQSPRRKELLSRLIARFEIIPAEIEESKFPFEELSLQKAIKVGKSHPDELVLAADTIVVKDGRVFGKPATLKEAEEFLTILSGNVHEVKTSYTLYCENLSVLITRVVVSKVRFNDLSRELIASYIATGSPMDKAGGYGIQDADFPLVKSIEGSYTNVVGLPLESLKEDLESLGLIA